jgi:DNA-binding NarL/FixJ family response regulator
MTEKISIMLVEDNPDYRQTLELAIETEPTMELAGTFGAAEIALRSLQDKAVESKPDIILLDLNLPAMSGIEALPRFSQYAPDSQIIILTQSNAEADVLAAIEHGAAGYLLKSSTVSQIKKSICNVQKGDAPLDAGVAKYILEALQNKTLKNPLDRELSPRELEVITLLSKGLVKKEIGDRLNITYGTVATHIRSIYDKLNVINAPSAISKAYEAGILPVAPED